MNHVKRFLGTLAGLATALSICSGVQAQTVTGTLGSPIVRGEAIAEIETEKATVEMEVVSAGILVEIVAEAGTELPVGAPIGWLDDGS